MPRNAGTTESPRPASWSSWDEDYEFQVAPSGTVFFRERGVDAWTTGRTCPRCGTIAPLTRRFFYIRGNGRPEYCVGCHASYYRERAVSRRVARNPAVLKFGVEIEYSFRRGTEVVDRSHVAALINEQGVECHNQNYNHQRVSYWKVVPDSSVNAGGEVVSPPMTMDDAAFEQIGAVCRALKAARATADSACGLHVHLEVRGYRAPRIQNVFQGWYNNQHVIDQMVARSRRNGRWCQHLTSTDMTYVGRVTNMENARRQLSMLDRYKNLNGTCYPRYGTLEVRLHQGTVQANKIEHWVRLCRSLVTMFSEGSVLGRTLDELLADATGHGLPQTSANFMRGRAATLGLPREEPAPTETIVPASVTFDPDQILDAMRRHGDRMREQAGSVFLNEALPEFTVAALA